MKMFFIPIRKYILVNIFLAVIIFVLIFSFSGRETRLTLNNPTADAIYKGNEQLSMVAFECNVVWGTEYVPQMLDIFKEHQINITFFIGGEWARDNPDLLMRMMDEGHELGNHGYYHKHHSKLNMDQNRKEIKDTENVIKDITGITTTLFAPPYGEYNKTTLQAAHSLGYKTIMWSIDTIDWRRDGVDNIVQRVMKNPHNGAFILMHPTKDTVTALPIIIERLQSQGYDIGKVSDLLG